MKKQLIIVIGLSLLSFKSIYAQWFSTTPISTDSLVFGNLDWGDYDQDGDQDLLAMGATVSGDQKTVLYAYEDGVFSEVETPFINAQNGTCEFFDFDNDNDLDVIISGFSGDTEGAITKTYKNESGIFEEVDLGLDSSYFTSIIFFDYDNDGDNDLLLTGWINEASPGSVLFYRNEIDSFAIDTSITFPSLSFGAIDATDLDHDGNIDVVVAGANEGFTGYAEIFEYDPLTLSFIPQSYEIEAVTDAWVKFFDYNDDGNDDLLLYGVDSEYNNRLIIYKNDGASLSLHQSLDSLNSSTSKNPVITGDIDNDGDNDIIVGGSNSDWDYTMVAYLNEADSFIVAPQVELPEWGSNTSLAFCDTDGDLDLDFSFAGRDNATIDVIGINLFENDSANVNTAPQAPITITHTIEDSSVTLHWERGTDAETRLMGLTYNLGLYYITASKWILPPKALNSGKRLVTKRGNMLQDTTFKVVNLAPGMYEWKVQTLDNAYVPSEFTVNSFEILDGSSVGLEEEFVTPLVCAPVPFSSSFTLKNQSEKAIKNIVVYTITGEIVEQIESITANSTITILTDKWQSGTYFVRFNTENKVLNQRVIKN